MATSGDSVRSSASAGFTLWVAGYPVGSAPGRVQGSNAKSPVTSSYNDCLYQFRFPNLGTVLYIKNVTPYWSNYVLYLYVIWVVFVERCVEGGEAACLPDLRLCVMKRLRLLKVRVTSVFYS